MVAVQFPAEVQSCLPGSYLFRLLPLVAATFPKGTAEPSQSRLTACQLPRGGSFISAYRQMRKSSPFGGAGAVAPERVGVPLRADFPRPGEDVA